MQILPSLEMAEIRLDHCKLSDQEIEELFAQTDVPLIATCRAATLGGDWAESERRLTLAVQAGARYADLEIEAPSDVSRRFQKLCHEWGTALIRSYHDFGGTPDEKGLQIALARCFRYGADIAKIVTTCHSAEDAARIESLYSLILEDVDSMEGRLVAFGMGNEGRRTRIECLRRGAPFTYAARNAEEATAPGQPTTEELQELIYGAREPWVRTGLRMPALRPEGNPCRNVVGGRFPPVRLHPVRRQRGRAPGGPLARRRRSARRQHLGHQGHRPHLARPWPAAA